MLLLLLALLLRLGWGWTRPPVVDRQNLPDQAEYLQLAQNLLHEHQLRFYDDRPSIADTVYAYRMPGYPFFLAALGANVRAARLAQGLLDTLTVLAVYLLARRWLDRSPALLAAGIVAVNPFLIYFSGLILSETLFTAMLAWAMVLLVGSRIRSDSAGHGGLSYTRFLLGGLLLALSILVRPSALFLPILLGVAGAWVNRPAATAYHTSSDQALRRWKLPVVTTMLLLTVLVLLPWAYRNHRVLGRWIWTTTNGGVTLYDGFNPAATGASDQSFLRQMPWLRYPNQTELGRSIYLSNRAKQWMLEHPAKVLQLALVKIGRTWSPIPLSREYGGQLRYVLVGLFYSLPVDLLVILGLMIGKAGGGLSRSAKGFLLIPAIYFTVVHGLSVGSLRYRVPVEPPMAVIAAVALAGLLMAARHRPRSTDHEPQSPRS
jgi:4-amino-4-deoxy-L-arabinose transferase-like glycosyltransferase